MSKFPPTIYRIELRVFVNDENRFRAMRCMGHEAQHYSQARIRNLYSLVHRLFLPLAESLGVRINQIDIRKETTREQQTADAL